MTKKFLLGCDSVCRADPIHMCIEVCELLHHSLLMDQQSTLAQHSYALNIWEEAQYK